MFLRIDQPNQESEAVQVKKVSVTEGNTHGLCLSEGTARKELAMDGQAEQRFLDRNILSTHQQTMVILTDDQNRVHHVRVSGRPKTEH